MIYLMVGGFSAPLMEFRNQLIIESLLKVLSWYNSPCEAANLKKHCGKKEETASETVFDVIPAFGPYDTKRATALDVNTEQWSSPTVAKSKMYHLINKYIYSPLYLFLSSLHL